MSDDSIRPELVKQMNEIGALLDKAINSVGKPRQYGFALLVFDHGPSGFMNYISNAEREDMARAMREFLARWQAQGIGAHETATWDGRAKP